MRIFQALARLAESILYALTELLSSLAPQSPRAEHPMMIDF